MEEKNFLKGYFAAQDSDKLASTVLNKANFFMNTLDSTGQVTRMRDSFRFYHGLFFGGEGHRVMFGGDQGEITHLAVNHYRNIGKHIHVMVTANRPSMTARATNTDYKSIVQTNLADSLLDYYMREKRLEKFLNSAVECAIILGAGYVKMDWDATSGEIWDYMDDMPIYEGDVKFTNLTPFDVMFDGNKENNQHDWVVARTFKNKYDLAAKYPELASKIIGLPTRTDLYRIRFDGVVSKDESDDVPVYEFFHKKTDAMPEGRFMQFLSEDIVLFDGEMPYRELPIYRIVPSEVLGTSFGYTSMFDLIPLQEAVNSLYSSILTNQTAFATQNILVPENSNIMPSQLGGGLNVIEYNAQAGKPEALNLTATPPEVFQFIQQLIKEMETISGINSVARGNPESNLRSGNSMALVQSMALQFISGLQQSYVHLIEDVGTGLINMLKDFAQTPRVAAIVGKNNRAYLKEFKGSDLEFVNRVLVDLGNPLSQTKAGRVEMANNLLQYSEVTPEQYFMVLKTGNLDVMTEGINKELILVKGENEAMVNGEDVMATDIDEHILHIKEHRSVLADPDLRKDPDLVQRVLSHINEHIEALKQVDPNLLMILGQQPIQPPPPMQPMPQDPSMLPPPNMMAEGMDQVQAAMPTPPPPFENAPVTAEQALQQQGG